MSKLLVIEGRDEVIIGPAKNKDAIVKLWFTDGGRDLCDYDAYTVNPDEGFAIQSRCHLVDADCMEPIEL